MASQLSYFQSYEDLEVHRLMLEDRPRTSAYKNAIFENRSFIQDKVVMDVGSGTGILSIFCAQAGARRVHAVEASNIAELSRTVVEENGFGDVIQVHHCTVEELVLDEKVDVIVSEWMGFYLLHEGMLDSVLFARDKFLKPEGSIYPESADLWVAPCELPSYFSFWDDVHGVKMSCLGRLDRVNRHKPLVTEMSEKDVLAEGSVVKAIFLNTVTKDELQMIRCEAVVPALRPGLYQGLCVWFVCNFPGEETLSTHPKDPQTHWKQTIIALPQDLDVEEGDPIAFRLELHREDTERKYRMELTMLDPLLEEHPVPCGCNTTKCVIIKKYLEQNQMEPDYLEYGLWHYCSRGVTCYSTKLEEQVEIWYPNLVEWIHSHVQTHKNLMNNSEGDSPSHGQKMNCVSTFRGGGHHNKAKGRPY